MLFQLHEWDITSYAAVLMMPAGQVAQQRTSRRAIRRARPPRRAAAPGR
jgi:hypothetical protein